MTITVAQRDAEYADQFGSCDLCGTLVSEDELHHISYRGSPEVLCCESCYSDPR